MVTQSGSMEIITEIEFKEPIICALGGEQIPGGFASEFLIFDPSGKYTEHTCESHMHAYRRKLGTEEKRCAITTVKIKYV